MPFFSNLLTTLFSLVYWIFFAFSAMVLYVVAVLLCLATAPFDSNRTALHRYTCWWAQIYLRCLPGCRLRVEGREKILPRTPYVFVANHQSVTDIMALSALAVPFKWVSKKEAFRLPFIGWNMVLNQCVRVDRGNIRSAVATMARCRQWLDRKLPVMIFPEGHRSPDGEMLEFHSGAFKLAADSGCGVVPIVVQGTRFIYRGWRVTPCPGMVTIRVLDPVFPGQEKKSADLLRRQTYDVMRKALTELRA